MAVDCRLNLLIVDRRGTQLGRRFSRLGSDTVKRVRSSMTRVIFATLFCFGTLSAMVWADDPAQVNDTAVREAVSRSLPFLEKEGVAWMKDRGCMTCHHVPLLLWSHRAAQAHGLAVDVKKLAEWDEWTRKYSLANRNLFRLRNYELGKVEAAKLSDALKA